LKITSINKVTGRRTGMAIMLALLVFMVLSILVMHFFTVSQQSKYSSYRFMQAEIARQLAFSAQDEAFSILKNSFIFRDSPTDYYQAVLTQEARNKEIEIKTPQTENNLLPKKMLLKTTFRIADFKNTNHEGVSFSNNREGIGTLEIKTVVQPEKEEKGKHLSGGLATVIRHYDYKVITMMSDKQDPAYRDSGRYNGNQLLDYVLFVRNASDNFNSLQGASLNPGNPDDSREFGAMSSALDITVDTGSSENFGKVAFATRWTHEQKTRIGELLYFNLPKDNPLVNLDESPVKIDELNKSNIDAFFPAFLDAVRQAVSEKGGNFISASGYKAHVYEVKRPLMKDFFTAEPQAKDGKIPSNLRIIAAMTSYYLLAKNQFPSNSPDLMAIFPGTYNPQMSFLFEGQPVKADRLSQIFTSPVSRNYMYYRYITLDISQMTVTYSYKAGLTTKTETVNIGSLGEAASAVEKLAKQQIASIDNNAFSVQGLGGDMKFDVLRDLWNNNAKDRFLRLAIDEKYLPEDGTFNQDYFRDLNNKPLNTSFGETNELYKVPPPFANFQLYSRRGLRLSELETAGFLERTSDKNILKLDGFIELLPEEDKDFSAFITDFGEKKPLEIVGQGGIIANYIRINSSVTRANDNALCVFMCTPYTHQGIIYVQTEEEINAVLVAMSKRRSYNDTLLEIEKNMKLRGAVLVDNMPYWGTNSNKSEIIYDQRLNSKNLNLVHLAPVITFERVVERAEDEGI